MTGLRLAGVIAAALLVMAQAGIQPPPDQQAAPAPGDQGAPAAPPPPQWLPRGGAQIKVLDKIDARSQTMTAKAGDTLKFDTLSITVQKCIVRPPDQEADAAAFLDITDTKPSAPTFHGWMFENEPSLNMFASPVYDVRVLGCTP